MSLNKLLINTTTKKFILNGTVIVLGLALGINLFFLYKDIQNNNSKNTNEYSDFSNYLKEEEYYRMVFFTYKNEVAGIKPTPLEQPYVDIAKYYEAASYYVVYQNSDPQKADTYLAVMDSKRENLSSDTKYLKVIENINEDFGIDSMP